MRGIGVGASLRRRTLLDEQGELHAAQPELLRQDDQLLGAAQHHLPQQVGRRRTSEEFCAHRLLLDDAVDDGRRARRAEAYVDDEARRDAMSPQRELGGAA